MVVQHNMLSMFTGRQLGITGKDISKNTEKLSSGYRINRAADDAAGLSISEKLRTQIRGLNRASENSQTAISFCQVADGAMSEMHAMLDRMKEISVQAANDTNTEADRAALQEELDNIIGEMDRVTQDTEFNTLKVFGRERVKTTTTPATSGAMTASQVATQIYSVVGNNYGLAEVIGADHMSSTNKLNDVLDFTDGVNGLGDWYTTGKTQYNGVVNGSDVSNQSVAQVETYLQSIDSRLSADISQVKMLVASGMGTLTSSGSTWQYYNWANGNNSVSMTFKDNTLYKVSAYGQTTSNGMTTNQQIMGVALYNPNQIGSAAVQGSKYGSVWIDFSGAGIDYQISDLYNEGFNTTCATCSRFYSISFTDKGTQTSKEGVNYSLISDSTYPRLEVDISDCTNGDDIVQHIISAVNSCSFFNEHYTQYAYNDAEKGKLYMYDNRVWETGGGSSSFEPSYRRTDGTLSIQSEKTVTNPTTGAVTHYQDKDLWIQTGANAGQGIWLNKPHINNATLGIDGLSVMDYESANEANAVIDRALVMVSSERARMGAFSNRFEHVVKIDDNTSENLQTAESKIRDTDMATEMASYSKNNILQQAGQAVLAQANQSQMQILSLLE